MYVACANEKCGKEVTQFTNCCQHIYCSTACSGLHTSEGQHTRILAIAVLYSVLKGSLEECVKKAPLCSQRLQAVIDNDGVVKLTPQREPTMSFTPDIRVTLATYRGSRFPIVFIVRWPTVDMPAR